MRQFRVFDSPNAEWRISLELRDNELRALGHMTAQWSFLENLVRRLSMLLAEVSERPMPKGFQSDSFRQRTLALRELCAEIPSGEDREFMISLLDRAGSLQGERQRLTHGILEWNEADRDVLNVRSHKNPDGAPWKVKAEDIEDVARKIAELNCAIWNWPNKSPWETIAYEVDQSGGWASGISREGGTTTKTPNVEPSPELNALLARLAPNAAKGQSHD